MEATVDGNEAGGSLGTELGDEVGSEFCPVVSGEGSTVQGAQNEDGVQAGLEPELLASDAADEVTVQLLAALEAADDLPLDQRLELLRQAEASIAGVLEGLDGL